MLSEWEQKTAQRRFSVIHALFLPKCQKDLSSYQGAIGKGHTIFRTPRRKEIAPVPQLEVYDDAWHLTQTPTFAAVMKDLTQMSWCHEPTPDEVSALLIAHDFTDQSDRPLEESNG